MKAHTKAEPGGWARRRARSGYSCRPCLFLQSRCNVAGNLCVSLHLSSLALEGDDRENAKTFVGWHCRYRETVSPKSPAFPHSAIILLCSRILFLLRPLASNAAAASTNLEFFRDASHGPESDESPPLWDTPAGYPCGKPPRDTPPRKPLNEPINGKGTYNGERMED